MAKDTNDKSTKDLAANIADAVQKQPMDTAPYRVNYTFVHKHELRAGAYIINASSAAEAKEKAHRILQDCAKPTYRITKVSLY